MKKILPIVIIAIFILSGFGASALNNDIKENNSNTIEYQQQPVKGRDFTHTVLLEFGTTSSCTYCPAVRGYLNEIYSSNDYDFYYVTLNGDKDPLANARYWEIPKSSGSVPQVFFDGGFQTLIGDYHSTSPYINYINNCGSRSVADIDLEVSVVWLGSATMEVTVNATNNETSSYSGHLHAYVTEIESRWYDHSYHKYDFSMIGYAFNKNINIDADSTWSETVTWNGGSHGYSDIKEDNIMIIASVFDSSSKYVDETAAIRLSGDVNDPPESPGIYGPKQGIPEKEYDFIFISRDPEDSDIWFYIDWGDGSIEEWIGPYKSDEEVIVSHTWNSEGLKSIEAMAKDDQGEQSDISTKSIDIQKARYSNNQLLLRFLERYSKIFPILEKLLGV